MPYVHVHNDDEYKQSLESAGELPVVVKTSASWCGPCRAIAPYFEGLADDFKEVYFISLDADECLSTSKELHISALPTFIALRNRKEFDRVVGADKNKLKTLVEKHSTTQEE